MATFTTKQDAFSRIFDWSSRPDKDDAAHHELPFDPPDIIATSLEYNVELIRSSDAFKRLAEKGMMVPSLSPTYTNRQQHSEHAASIAKKIAGYLKLNYKSQALCTAIALAHDIGHPPFCHEGEKALNEKLKPYGLTFNHDDAGIRILQTNLSFLDNSALRLTKATLDGIRQRHHKTEGRYNHIEGQIAATADWIAGTITDIKDMMHLYIASHDLKQSEAFFKALCESSDLLRETRAEVLAELRQTLKTMEDNKRRGLRVDRHAPLPIDELVHEFCIKLEKHLIEDVVVHTYEVYERNKDHLVDAISVRTLDELMATFSPSVREQLEALKTYYHDDIYPSLLRNHGDTVAMVSQVFDDLMHGKVRMQGKWDQRYSEIGEQDVDDTIVQQETAQLVADYIVRTMTEKDVWEHINKYHPDLVNKATPVPENTRPTRYDIRKHRVEHDLNHIRNEGRLAIHMNEIKTESNYQVTAGTLNNFRMPADTLRDGIRNYYTANHNLFPLVSMSLLPAGNHAIQPWEAENGIFKPSNYGYLVDLRHDDKPHPARVVGASQRNMGSDCKGGRKSFWEQTHEFLPDDSAYRSLADHEWIQSCAGERSGVAIHTMLLDRLKNHYNGTARVHTIDIDSDANCSHEVIQPWNEIIVAASCEHIKAITIPVMDGDQTNLDYRAYFLESRLMAALVGLQHLDNIPTPLEVPVVFYYMGTHRTSKPNGHIGYVGQGREELRQVAFETLAAYQPLKNNRWHIRSEFASLVQSVLNIDMDRPLSEQIPQGSALTRT